jgi:hypothetical protein
MRKKSVKNKTIKVKGILIPEAWNDENGQVVAAHIATNGEKNYALDCNTIKGQELLKHLQQEIEVTGMLIQRNHAPVQIRVNDYKLLKNDNLEHKEKQVEKLWQIKRS